MQYKGIELKEITEPQIFNPPKLMLVWDDDNESPCQLNVYAIINREDFQVITERSAWQHCAEIPEVLATNRELARWLAEGKGEVMLCGAVSEVSSSLSYDSTAANKLVAGKVIVRKWNETDWHLPTREYLGLED